MEPRVLFTGFTPFQEHERNASWAVAEAAAASFGADASARLLDVTFEEARSVASTRLARELIVAIGIAPTKSVRVERLGKNVRGTSSDNAGTVAPGTLVGAGPVQRVSRVAESGFADLLAARCPLPVVISEDAGEYVCNALFYHLLGARDEGGAEAVFVHIPQLDPSAAAHVGAALAEAARAWLEGSGTNGALPG